MENLHVLSCSVLLKSVLLISCVFWIFFQNASSQLCFRFFKNNNRSVPLTHLGPHLPVPLCTAGPHPPHGTHWENGLFYPMSHNFCISPQISPQFCVYADHIKGYYPAIIQWIKAGRLLITLTVRIQWIKAGRFVITLTVRIQWIKAGRFVITLIVRASMCKVPGMSVGV